MIRLSGFASCLAAVKAKHNGTAFPSMMAAYAPTQAFSGRASCCGITKACAAKAELSSWSHISC